MKVETKLLNTNFDVKGWSVNFQNFSPVKFFADYMNSVQGYYVSNKLTNIICIKGMICLVTFSLDDSELNEFFIGDLNRWQVCIPKNVAFAWKNISSCESIVISDMNDIKLTIDTNDEDKQNSVLGYSIPYRF